MGLSKYINYRQYKNRYRTAQTLVVEISKLAHYVAQYGKTIPHRVYILSISHCCGNIREINFVFNRSSMVAFRKSKKDVLS